MELYSERSNCIFCQSAQLKTQWETNYTIPLGCYVIPDISKECYSMPFNVLECEACHMVQTKYLGNQEIIYDYNANAHGTIRSTMNTKFADFVSSFQRSLSILEIGGGNGGLSELILEKNSNISYTIVDPTYSGSNENRTIIRNFIEQVPEETLATQSIIVMSHVFEHFYEPIKILELFEKYENIQYIYLNMPDLESYVTKDNYHVLNPEHIYYIEKNYLMALFEKYGFETQKYSYHENHSIFYEFKRMNPHHPPSYPLMNINATADIAGYFQRILDRIENINKVLDENKDVPFYIWPCSMHTIYLFALGLDESKVTAILDNSPHKIGQYLYGSKKQCISFQEIVESEDKAVILLNGGCYNEEIKNKEYPNKIFI